MTFASQADFTPHLHPTIGVEKAAEDVFDTIRYPMTTQFNSLRRRCSKASRSSIDVDQM